MQIARNCLDRSRTTKTIVAFVFGLIVWTSSQPAIAQYLPHEAGEPIFRTDEFTVFKSQPSRWADDRWCSNNVFQVVVVHRVKESEVVKPEFLTGIFKKLIIPLGQELCPPRGTVLPRIISLHYFDGVFIDDNGNVSQDSSTVESFIDDIPFAKLMAGQWKRSANAKWMGPGVNYLTGQNRDKPLSVERLESRYENYVEESASLSGIKRFWDRGGYFVAK